jgi:zinc transporter ZupT
MIPPPALVTAGAIAMGYAIAAVFFLRFWTTTRDRLFLAFAGAFLLMSLNQGLPALLEIPREEQSGFYLLRLGAFLLLIVAIVAKNLGGKPGSR